MIHSIPLWQITDIQNLTTLSLIAKEKLVSLHCSYDSPECDRPYALIHSPYSERGAKFLTLCRCSVEKINK